VPPRAIASALAHRSSFIVHRSAFTLLEVLLALGLTVVVLGLVSMSINTTLKLVDAGQSRTERDQLARAILTRIAGDVRGTFRYQPFDATGMMSVKTSTSSSSKGGQSGGNNSTKGGNGNNSNNNNNNNNGNNQSTANSSSDSSSSTSTSDQSSTSSTGGQTASTSYPGLYGDQYGLQIDVARLPRFDEYAFADSSGTSGAPTDTSSTPPISDVKTVAYYVTGPQAQVSTVVSTASGQSSGDSGLVRAETDRAALVYSSQQSGTTASDAGSIVAPEVVALEFQYFDGSNWQTSWDTTQGNGLPQLIKISLALSNPSRPKDQQLTSGMSIADLLSQDPDSVYTMVVRMAASDPVSPASSSSSGSSGSGSGGSGTSGTSGAGAGSGGTAGVPGKGPG
jgi:type II secretory pathway pseudopilin PulG